MADEKFLITGGQGFIGAWTAKRLLDEDVPFVILDRTPENGILSQVIDSTQLVGVERVFVDIAEPDKVAEVVNDHGITRIIHLAGLQVPTCRADPLLGARVNVLGTLNVFEAARRQADQVRSVVYASSAAVAGDVGDYSGPILDDTPHVPRTHYGVFKSANEGNARVYYYDHGIRSVGLRPYTVYGVGREVGITSGPTKAIKAAVLGRPYEIAFSGTSSFVFVEDLAEIFVAAGRADKDGAFALNVRGIIDSVERYTQLLEEIVPESKNQVSVSGGQLPIAYDVEERGLAEILDDNVPQTPLKEGIAKTADHFRELAEGGRLHVGDL